jgi:hypothetical protein
MPAATTGPDLEQMDQQEVGGALRQLDLVPGRFSSSRRVSGFSFLSARFLLSGTGAVLSHARCRTASFSSSPSSR